MADPQNSPVGEGAPTVKAFNDLTGFRYYCDPDLRSLGHWEEDFENPEEYEPGGLCPIDVSIKDKPSFINDRFQVIYKLGYGGFGSVWLCYEVAVKKWRAVKVSKASLDSDNNGELLVNSVMRARSVTVTEALDNHVVLPLETFWIDSVNGRHLCTVLPLLGPRLSDWSMWIKQDDPDLAKRISLQMVKGMNFLHGHGICHGDFRPQNILMQLNDGAFDYISIDEMYDILAVPRIVEIRLRNDGSKSPYSPDLLFSCHHWGMLKRFVGEKIAIVDFGEAYLSTSSSTRQLGIPGDYAAPEVLLGGEKGIGTDIYALGRTLLDFRLRECIVFDWGDYWKVKAMEDFMGPCPPPFREHAMEIAYYSGEDDTNEEPETSKSPDSPSVQPMTCVMKYPYHSKPEAEYDNAIDEKLGKKRYRLKLSRDEVLSLGELLRNLFRWQPEERWDTDRILTHRWFTEKHESGEIPKQEPKQEPKQDPEGINGEEKSYSRSEAVITETSKDTQDDDTSTPVSSTQQIVPQREGKWIYLKLATVLLYLVGVLITLVYFLAHILANQARLYGDRPILRNCPVSPVVQYVSYRHEL